MIPIKDICKGIGCQSCEGRAEYVYAKEDVLSFVCKECFDIYISMFSNDPYNNRPATRKPKEHVKDYIEVHKLARIGLRALQAIEHQEKDESLWATGLDISESYIQQPLKWLHKVIEHNDSKAMDSIVIQSKDHRSDE